MTTRILESTPGGESLARHRPARDGAAERTTTFDTAFRRLFDEQFDRIFRYLDRLTADADTAADAAQEAFVRLHRRGAMPERPAAWLITVALNQMRNAIAQRGRRAELLTPDRARHALAEPPPSPAERAAAEDERRRVRRALDTMPERERSLLLLRAEGYSYREIAAALQLHEPSLGTLLARARERFRAVYAESTHAR